MARVPATIEAFLAGRTLAVAGVSRSSDQPANLIFRRLIETGHTVYAINPNAESVEGVVAYASPADLPEPVHGLMVCTAPRDADAVVAAALEAGVRHVWFHRSVGDGSVSERAVAACRSAGVEPIVGGCPMMFAGKVDVAHRCMRWILQRTGSVPS